MAFFNDSSTVMVFFSIVEKKKFVRKRDGRAVLETIFFLIFKNTIFIRLGVAFPEFDGLVVLKSP